ncbi:MAG: site-2 protease family protein, partial [Candidatus Omnitrophica bacterium]|nr:site-2 protease family protein [Candidatus Omnitrophota bacterium]
MSLLIFIVVLGILIIVHEWGHYIAARKQGIEVEQFSVGFGPKLFSWKADGTEFMVCAIPLGGFVK